MALSDRRDFGGLSRNAAEATVPSVGRPSVTFHTPFGDSDGDGSDGRDDGRRHEPQDENPESFVTESLKLKPRSGSHHLESTKIPSRTWLRTKAKLLRYGMAFGMHLHRMAKPKPAQPAFVRRIQTETIPIELYFYVPSDYQTAASQRPAHRYPIVVNFHGGGFCLGHATDDAYWARIILAHTPAVLVSVNYRLAPEHPFPLPVDDCVEALLYLQSNAEELRLDPGKIALSGFSSGANLAFTVPFRLTYHYERQTSREHLPLLPKNASGPFSTVSAAQPSDSTRLLPHAEHATPSSSMLAVPGQAEGRPAYKRVFTDGPRSHLLRTLTQGSHLSSRPDTQIRIISILAWYPLLDWTLSRSEKKRMSRKPEKTLSRFLTDLFDFSYLPAPDVEGSHRSPYASPSLAPDHMIQDGLPQRMQLWLCEYDMLLAEGEIFSERLQNINKDCRTEVIKAVPHAWDKKPNPYRDQTNIDALYVKAAGYLTSVFQEASRRETVGEGIGLGGMR